MSGEGDTSRARDAFAASQTGRDRSLLAIHRLEEALGRAAASRGWLEGVTDDLVALRKAFEEERHASIRPDALLPLIASENPRRFGSRVEHLQSRQDEVLWQLQSLSGEIAVMKPEQVDAADLRQRLGWVVRTIRRLWERQTDLVYEALELDLGRR